MTLYDVGGAIRIAIDDTVPPKVGVFVRGQMRPYAPCPDDSGAGGADVILSCADQAATAPLLDVEGPTGDGLTTGFDGERIYVLVRGRRCAVPDALRGAPSVFEFEPGFPVGEVWAPFVKPALSLAALRHGSAVVHATAVAVDGGAVLVAGWSESGKTEVGLALAERGATFVSDKWSLLGADRTVAPFPATVGVRRWVLPYLPRLRAALSPVARAQVAGARVATAVAAPFRGGRSSNPVMREVSGMLAAGAELADRVSMTQDEVRRIYGFHGDASRPLPLRAIVLLDRVPRGGSLSVRTADVAALARRLAISAAYERREYFSLTSRAAFAGSAPGRGSIDEAIDQESSIVRRSLDGTAVLEAETAFPADPRRLATVILKAVS
jgi:hypothetical protein